MEKIQYSDLFLDQTKDLIWAVDKNLYLVYANSAYLNLMKEVTRELKELNTPILVEGFGEGYIEKWKVYYNRWQSGESFEIEEHFYNPEAENLLNKSAEEVLGRNIWGIFSPAKGTYLEDVYRRVASTGQPENFEYLYPGNGAWHEVTTSPSGGGLSAYFKNDDERKKAAQELDMAYGEKNEILESIGYAFFAVDKDWTVTYWNKQAELIMGKVKKDIVGKTLWEEFPDAIETECYVQYRCAMETGETVNIEGSEFYFTIPKKGV